VRQIRLSRTFLQCASCRFSALYFIPFCGGLAASGALDAIHVVLGAAFWCVITLAIEVTNRLSDRVEDAINRPERTRLCACVGWQRLGQLEKLLWCVVAVSAIVWLALAPGILLAGLITLGVCAGIGYSRGPRLARRRMLVFVVLSGTFVGPFSLGWATSSHGASMTDATLLGRFVPLFWLGTLFITSLAGIKDVTDRAGDEAIGYNSAFLQLAHRHGTVALLLLTSLPFAALGTFVAAGWLSPLALPLLGLLPISIGLGLAVRGARDSTGAQLAIREALYHHWLAFTSIVLLACFPSTGLLAAVLAGWAGWVLASRYAHWADPLRLTDLGMIVRLARAGLTTPRNAPGRKLETWTAS
jgi:4-hydroxybenzoate polyprenyltransferase